MYLPTYLPNLVNSVIEFDTRVNLIEMGFSTQGFSGFIRNYEA